MLNRTFSFSGLRVRLHLFGVTIGVRLHPSTVPLGDGRALSVRLAVEMIETVTGSPATGTGTGGVVVALQNEGGAHLLSGVGMIETGTGTEIVIGMVIEPGHLLPRMA